MRKVLSYLAIVLTLLGCTLSATEPRDPHWHKENCSHCRMALSERRFAAQIVTPQGARYYDDLGCALIAQDKDPELKNHPLFVVPDGKGAWQKADRLRYAKGMKTPMGYGYGAVSEGGTLSLAEIKATMLQIQLGNAQGGHRHD